MRTVTKLGKQFSPRRTIGIGFSKNLTKFLNCLSFPYIVKHETFCLAIISIMLNYAVQVKLLLIYVYILLILEY